jgi:hypothetical protein
MTVLFDGEIAPGHLLQVAIHSACDSEPLVVGNLFFDSVRMDKFPGLRLGC